MEVSLDEINKELEQETVESKSKREYVKGATYYCPQCGRDCKAKGKLLLHIKSVHDNIRDHVCDQCGKGFPNELQMRAHQERVHEGKKEYVCTICQRPCVTKDSLLKHTRIHTGEKPFTCELCGRAFSDPSALRGHRKTHSENRDDYKCQDCPKVFRYNKGLREHMRKTLWICVF